MIFDDETGLPLALPINGARRIRECQFCQAAIARDAQACRYCGRFQKRGGDLLARGSVGSVILRVLFWLAVVWFVFGVALPLLLMMAVR